MGILRQAQDQSGLIFVDEFPLVSDTPIRNPLSSTVNDLLREVPPPFFQQILIQPEMAIVKHLCPLIDSHFLPISQPNRSFLKGHLESLTGVDTP